MSCSGRIDEARALFERLLALRNDVGLLAEEYDPRAATAARQFSAGLLPLALVNTAHNLASSGGARAWRLGERHGKATKPRVGGKRAERRR